MRQRFFATFTIASVVPFSGQDAPLVQAVSLSSQNQNTMVTSMNEIDESIHSFAHLQTSEGVDESEQHMLVQKSKKKEVPSADEAGGADKAGAKDDLT